MMSSPTQGSLNDLLDRQKAGPYQLFTVFLCFVVMVIDGYDLFMISMAIPRIADDLGVSAAALAPVLALQNLGLALGTATIGIFSDRFGRKPTLSFSIAAFSALTFLSATAQEVVSFAIWRLLTGFFLAGVIPNVIALTNEMSSARFRQGFVGLVYSGYAIGAALASLAFSTVFRDLSWQAIFGTAGLAGFLILLVVIPALPESIRYLLERDGKRDQALRQLRRMLPGVELDPALLHRQARQGDRPPPPAALSSLLVRSRRRVTLLMWTMFALSFLSLTSFAALGPVILNLTAKLPLETTGSLMVTYSLGGLIGSALCGFVLDRLGGRTGLMLWYAGAAGGWLLLAFNIHGGTAGHVAIFLAGFAMMGAQGALNSFVATVYPTSIRATGVGWAFGVGRLAAIASPLLFSGFVAAPGRQTLYFVLLALPVMLVTLCLPFLTRARANVTGI